MKTIAGPGNDARVLGLMLIVLAVLTEVFMVRVIVAPRRRRRRSRAVAGLVLVYLGAGGLIVLMVAHWFFHVDVLRWFGIAFPPLLVLLFVGALLMMKGTPPAVREWAAQVGTRHLYRKSWLGLPLRIVAALWLAAGVVYATIPVSGHWTIYGGAYVTFVLLGVGTVGAVLMAAGRKSRWVWMDQEGRLSEPTQLEMMGFPPF